MEDSRLTYRKKTHNGREVHQDTLNTMRMEGGGGTEDKTLHKLVDGDSEEGKGHLSLADAHM